MVDQTLHHGIMQAYCKGASEEVEEQLTRIFRDFGISHLSVLVIKADTDRAAGQALEKAEALGPLFTVSPALKARTVVIEKKW